MHPFPHHYRVAARAGTEGRVVLEHAGLDPIESSSPVEFDGPGDAWSPEGLLVAAVADCLVLTFRAVARASKLTWTALDVQVTGTLERVERTSSFTRFDIVATLRVGPDVTDEAADAALQKAERGCLISNSLKGEKHLQVIVDRDGG
jgi:organic hydroperoxide reductase OsmC/OhrA